MEKALSFARDVHKAIGFTVGISFATNYENDHQINEKL